MTSIIKKGLFLSLTLVGASFVNAASPVVSSEPTLTQKTVKYFMPVVRFLGAYRLLDAANTGNSKALLKKPELVKSVKNNSALLAVAAIPTVEALLNGAPQEAPFGFDVNSDHAKLWFGKFNLTLVRGHGDSRLKQLANARVSSTTTLGDVAKAAVVVVAVNTVQKRLK